MKKLAHVYSFELANYFKSKSFVFSTLLICLLAIVGLTVTGAVAGGDSEDEEQGTNVIAENIGLCDKDSLISDDMILSYGKAEISRYDSEQELEEAVRSEKVEVGFDITSLHEYDYIVNNKDAFDSTAEIFNEIMGTAAKMQYCTEHGLDFAELSQLESENIQCHEKVLGKDSEQNYWYSYVLVIVVFMVIIMYGMMIATSVANEKSNRTVEILVTSTTPSSLLFGKVLAGATAVVFQMGLIFGSIIGTYKLNQDALGGMAEGVLNMFFDIPTQVIVGFAVFGLGGFLLYAFMYGMLGALVSKIEDLNQSAGTAQMLVMVIYFLVLFQMGEPDGFVIRILSWLPISSYSAMFIRIAMGEVAVWEIIGSAVILYISVIGMGFVGAKVFRNSTLRYGNPIKLVQALKNLKGENNLG